MTTTMPRTPDCPSRAQSFGSLVRAYRHQAGLSMAAVAELARCSESYISRIEQGDRTPDGTVAERLDQELGAAGQLLTARESSQQGARRRPLPRAQQIVTTAQQLMGVEDWVSELDAASITTRPIVVTGPGGVGKTSVVMHWAACRADRYGEGAWILSCRGRSLTARPRTAHELVTTLLTDLGVHDLPQVAERRAALLRSTLHHRRALVILDDVADAEQIRPILDIPGITVVVTSRSSLPGLVVSHDALELTLPPCDHALARRLLQPLIGPRSQQVETSVLDRITTACDGLPLPLRVAAQWARRHKHATLQELAEQLETAPVETLHAATGGDARVSMRTVLEGSLQHLRQTAPEAVAVLEQAATAATAAERDSAHAQLHRTELGDILAREHLVLPTAEGYRLAVLVTNYLTEQAAAVQQQAAAVSAA